MTGQLSRRRQPLSTLSLLATFVSVLLMVSFSVLILSIVGGFRLGNMLVHSNPFAAYEAVWPGQSIASVAVFAQQTSEGVMSCISGASPEQQYASLKVQVAAGAYDALRLKMSCMYAPRDRIFRWMSVSIAHDQVQELELFSNVLQQDSLLLYWGVPDTISPSGNAQLMELYWERTGYSAMASIEKADSVVKLLSLKTTES